MIRLLLLGPQGLTGDEGQSLTAVLAQPKRFGLLAFLAVEGARHAVRRHRRDELLAMFWPEQDESRARRGLTYALYFLRRELGSGVVVGQREEVSLDSARLWCDVWAFEQALDDGRPDEALSLYRGDFLAGFFSGDAPDLEHWADGKRFRLRERAREAAWALVEGAARAGATADGIRAARRALEIASDDERAVRALVSLLQTAGDTAGALAEYEHFARGFQELRGGPPSPMSVPANVRVAAARVNTTFEPPVPIERGQAAEPTVVARDTPAPAAAVLGTRTEVTETTAHPAPPAQAVVAETGRVRRQRIGDRIRIALGAAIAVAVIGAAAATWRFRETQPSPGVAAVVAVMPLAYHGSPDLSYTGDGLTSLIAGNIDQFTGLRSVNTRLLMSGAGGSESRRTPDDAAAAAQRFGAGAFVLGDVTAAGRRLRISATWYANDGGRPRPLGGVVVAEGPTDSLFELADRITAGLTAARTLGRGGSGQPRSSATALKSTASLPALRAFLDGERAFRAGRYDAAIVSYRQAVAIDSGFALAFFRMSQAANWTGDSRVQRIADEQTQLRSGRLPPRDRRRALAWHESMAFRPAVAEGLYRDLVAEDPTDVEAWYYLADLVYHWGAWSLGKPASESRVEWARVLALEPNDASALIHLARLAAADGDHAGFDSLTNRLVTLNPSSDLAPEVRALRAFAFAGGVERAAVATEFAREPFKLNVAADVAGHVMATSSDLEGVDALWAAIEHDVPAPENRGMIALQRASVALARGQIRAAYAFIDSATTTIPIMAVRYRALAATLPFVAARRQMLDDALDRLMRADASAARPDAPAWRDYLIGRIALRRGDVQEATRRVTALQARSNTDRSAAELAPMLRADVALAAGRTADALAAIGPRPMIGASFADPTSTLTSASERWVRAEVYAKIGRAREALRVFASIPDPAGGDVAFAAAAHLRRGELHESLGERAEAAGQYRRAIGYWLGADVDVRPLMDRARTGLARVAGR